VKKIAAALVTAALALTAAPAEAHDWRKTYSGNVLRVKWDGSGNHRVVMRDNVGDGDANLMLLRVDKGEGGRVTWTVPYNGAVVRRELPWDTYRVKIGETNRFTGERTWGSWRSI
jgi:opacity protein-like surface antigen